MTDNEIKLAIAEACGWTGCRLGGYGAGGAVNRSRRSIGTPPGRKYTCELPDYVNDLNAMHEAEKLLTSEQVTKYIEYLDFFVEGQGKWLDAGHFATARQRAEAFLRTLNKWKD